MKTLLIVPPFNMIKEGYGSKKKIKEGNLPPLGICYIAAILKKEKQKTEFEWIKNYKIFDRYSNNFFIYNIT